VESEIKEGGGNLVLDLIVGKHDCPLLLPLTFDFLFVCCYKTNGCELAYYVNQARGYL
jgi:hypothetical protein